MQGWFESSHRVQETVDELFIQAQVSLAYITLTKNGPEGEASGIVQGWFESCRDNLMTLTLHCSTIFIAA